ncbi:FAD/NAD(P)-binding domain-containing protein [Zopfia rhizophila CBS 207.26]|uniref:FAD/NAD(P)-binding domain-containing protein n=1 Tax=Zopfia rhizophila CBS 207.26 TaxID=1314779 RepID=A0A6A6DWY9_9PEZI|nr:FAD/NAD(P)-binding domain-containing protein [Zopfia rhizophila CBS 207.26]
MHHSDGETKFDVVIVGAGVSGIIAAQRYLQVHPGCHLAILEQDYCLGGRLYHSFWTQWTHGLAEFSDMPMDRPLEQDCSRDLFKAKYTTEYLEKYVDQVRYAGRSLRERIQFSIQVQSIEMIESKWRLKCTDSSKSSKVFFATTLMIASGEASRPNLPDLPGKETFGGVIVHSHVTVIGAGKSAADMAYEAVKAGKAVTWLIRKNWHRCWAAQTRIMSSLQPSVLNKETWWAWFLHRTNIGIRIVKWIFSLLDTEVRKRADNKERKSTKGFEKPEYDTDIFWQNSTGGAVHHDDFWPLVAENVWVYRDEVKILTNKELCLKDGSHFPCDAVLCGTVEADEKVTKIFPLLANPPVHFHAQIDTTPYRLYHSIAPLADSYFDKNMVLPSLEEQERDIATWIAWCQRRYLSNGELGNFAAFDSIPYVDRLLDDIGITAHREGWLRDTFTPFMP